VTEEPQENVLVSYLKKLLVDQILELGHLSLLGLSPLLPSCSRSKW